MKKFLTTITLATLAFAVFGQTENIRFTARKNPAVANQIQVYAKNVSSTSINGILGASNLTVCIAFPRIYSASCTISTPIFGQTFDATIFRSAVGPDSIYAWNALGSTIAVTFTPGVEVNIANISFNTGFPNIATVKLYNAANGGPNDFEYNYIAPNGFEHCSYKNPFYSNVANDPLLVNANGSNNAFTQGNSYMGIADVSLPVKFTSFLVRKNGDNAQLNWNVESEDNNTLFYDIQASTDGRSFTNLSRINALKNGRSANAYSASDMQISRYKASRIYYRIKQTEANGNEVYSEIRQLSLDKQLYTVGLFPNFVSSTTKLVLEASEATNAMIVVTDAAGKKVQQFTWQLVFGNNQKEINVSQLAASTYMLSVSTTNGTETVRFVKR